MDAVAYCSFMFAGEIAEHAYCIGYYPATDMDRLLAVWLTIFLCGLLFLITKLF